MQIAVCSLVFLFVYTMGAAVRAWRTPAKVDLQGRLKNILDYEETIDTRQAELSRPLSERLLQPFLGFVSNLAVRLLPAEILHKLEYKVRQAGDAQGLRAVDYLGLKIVLAAALPSVLHLFFPGPWNANKIMFAAAGAAIGWLLPNMQLDGKIRQRREEIEKTFPDIIDLLSVSVEAGLGFDGAMAKVVEKSNGPMAMEFRRVLHEIKMGKSRREALRDLGERCGVDDVKVFTSTIIQAEQLGLNIGNTLKNQAEQMRRRRRQRVEEKAMKVPVKMLIPLVIFIFPTIFIVLLGPALIHILEIFAGF
ncbi:MAG: type II secretion system F family protein [Firmicutes bacterium]|jgi:tight adherence protein C|nr:type II secretion system F family protein [Bacillota bacterium]